MAAVHDDDDVAAELIARGGDEVARKRSERFGLEGWTYERELLVGITEVLLSVRSTLIAVNTPKGKAPPKVKPLPRPRTAMDRVEALQRQAARHELLAQLTPDHQLD